MTKHTIEFILPEDKEDLTMASRAPAYFAALWDIAQALRSMTKYSAHPTDGRELTEVEEVLASKIRSKFYEIISEHGLDDEGL